MKSESIQSPLNTAELRTKLSTLESSGEHSRYKHNREYLASAVAQAGTIDVDTESQTFRAHACCPFKNFARTLGKIDGNSP